MKVLIFFSIFLFSCSENSFVLEEGKLYNNGGLFSGIRKYKKSNIVREIHYKNGLKDGKETHWFASGQVFKEFNYKLGKPEGEQRTFFESGKKRKLTQFKDGQHHGDYIAWYESGQLLEYRKYVKGQGVGYKKWRANGQIYANYVVKNGKNIGLGGAELCFNVEDEKK